MKFRTLAAAVGAALALTACSSGNPMATSTTPVGGGATAAADSVIVGSANFPESELLAEIYAGALEAKGVQVTTKLNIASRETYVPALRNGEINLIPEYTGNFAKYLNKDADVADETKALAALRAALPENLVARRPRTRTPSSSPPRQPRSTASRRSVTWPRWRASWSWAARRSGRSAPTASPA